MAYFSRLTDIVTCNLSSILARSDQPAVALEEILREIQEGVAGAERSTRTAHNNVARIEAEIGEQRSEVTNWLSQAQHALLAEDDQQARLALARKHEVEDLIAGLEQQLQSAVNLRDHLQTMMHALQARLADAQRRMAAVRSGADPAEVIASSNPMEKGQPVPSSPSRVDAELERLRQQLRGK